MRVTAPLALLIVSLDLAGCGEEPTSPTLALSRTISTEHDVFHLDPRDQVDTAWQEAYYRWVVEELGITAGGDSTTSSTVTGPISRRSPAGRPTGLRRPGRPASTPSGRSTTTRGFTPW